MEQCILQGQFPSVCPCVCVCGGGVLTEVTELTSL